MRRLAEIFMWNVPYFRLSLTFAICLNLFSCSNKEYPDLSHLPLHYFDYERDCKRNNQCKSIGYGAGLCGDPVKNVGGYIVYSTSIGPENINRLKKLAKDSRYRSENCKAGLPCKDRILLEEVSGACTIHRKPALFCHNGKCRERDK